MLVSTLLSFFIGAAVAAPSTNYAKRDLAAFQSAFGAVSDATNAFDASVKAVSTSADVNTNLPDLTAKSNAIVTALTTGTATVNAQPALSLTDSLSLLSLSSTLTTAVNTTINDLISKKPLVDAATPPQTSFVLTQLQSVKSASQTFIAAVVAKVPDSVKSIANTQAQSVITALNRGITAYGGST
jgi:hypothetical protein